MVDLSFAINVAGAALFALVGIVVLLLSRGSRRGLLVGVMATTFGLTWVSENLSRGYRWFPRAAFWSFSLLAAVAAVALAYHLVKGASKRARTQVLVLALVLFSTWLVHEVLLFLNDSIIQNPPYSGFLFALILLTGAIAAAFYEAGPKSRGVACLSLAFCPFVVFLWAAFGATTGFGYPNTGIGHGVLYLLVGAVAAGLVIPFAIAPNSDPLSRYVFPALIVAGLAGVSEAFGGLPGSFGVVRTIGAFFLALAVLRYDLLMVPLPRFVIRRGTLATAALAVLIVIAEIAQNFFAAEHGLILGGLVAGSLIFVANPIQRAIERHGGSRRTTGPVDDPDREGSYRQAVRLALRDRKLTREEERDLLRLAHHLGIATPRAIEIHDELEKQIT